MTKISDLPASNNGQPIAENDKAEWKAAVAPVVAGGTTYKVPLQSMISNAVSGSSSSAPSGFIQSDCLYGVPQNLTITFEGDSNVSDSGYRAGGIYLCAHSTIRHVPGANTNGGDFDASPYVARGLSLKVTSVTNKYGVAGVEIVTPGQLYKVGDELQITRILASNSSSVDDKSSLTHPNARVKITKVNPFICGAINQSGSSGYNLGGATNDGCIDILSSNASSPHAYDGSDASPDVGYAMHDDPASPLYFQNNYNQAWSNVSDSNKAFHSNGGKSVRMSPGINEGDNYYQQSISCAVPGSWAVVYISRCIASTSGVDFDLDSDSISNPNWEHPILGAGSGFPDLVDAPGADEALDISGIKPIPSGSDTIIYTRVEAPNSGSHSTAYYNTYEDYPGFKVNMDISVWKYSSKQLSQNKTDANVLMGATLRYPLIYNLNGTNLKGIWDTSSGGNYRGQAAGTPTPNTNFNNTIFGLKSAGYNDSDTVDSWLYFCNSFYLVPTYKLLPQFSI